MPFPAPSNRTELKAYLESKLGGDFHTINISKNQWDMIINDSMEYFGEYVDGFMVERVLVLELKKDVIEYTLPEAVFTVLDVIKEGTIHGILGLFPNVFPEHVAIDWIDGHHGQYQGRVGTIGNLDIELELEDISLFKNRFLSRFLWEYNPFINKLVFQNAITDTLQVGLLVSQFVDMDGIGKSKLWNYKFLKEYAEALSWIQYGENLGKFDGLNIPGQGTINWQRFIDKGKEMKEKLEDTIIPNLADFTSTMSIHLA